MEADLDVVEELLLGDGGGKQDAAKVAAHQLPSHPHPHHPSQRSARLSKKMRGFYSWSWFFLQTQNLHSNDKTKSEIVLVGAIGQESIVSNFIFLC